MWFSEYKVSPTLIPLIIHYFLLGELCVFCEPMVRKMKTRVLEWIITLNIEFLCQLMTYFLLYVINFSLYFTIHIICVIYMVNSHNSANFLLQILVECFDEMYHWAKYTVILHIEPKNAYVIKRRLILFLMKMNCKRKHSTLWSQTSIFILTTHWSQLIEFSKYITRVWSRFSFGRMQFSKHMS